MRKFYILLLLPLLTNFSYGQDSITIIGKVTDQDGQPLSEVTISFAGEGEQKIPTDSTGTFYLIKKKKDYYVIGFEKPNYLRKTEGYHLDSNNADKLYFTIQLRHRNLAMVNTSKITRKDLSITIEQAIKKYKIDTTECLLQQEPPGIARGIQAELGDSTIIYIQIERITNWEYNFSKILSEKVTGIALAFPDCSKRAFGTGFVLWGKNIYNPYCYKRGLK